MDSSSTRAIIARVVSIVKGFQQAKDLFKKWRSRRKIHRPGEEELETSLETGVLTVESEWNNLSQEYGQAFDNGDSIISQCHIHTIAS
jgi:hypothetical protein